MKFNALTNLRKGIFTLSLVSAWGLSAFAATPILDKIVTNDAPTSPTSNVTDIKAQKELKEKVLVKGKVKDFVKGSSVFTIVDVKLKSCADNGESCPTPWDYCCETPTDISKNSATVIPVASPGEKKPVKESIQGVKGIKNLSTVAVYGSGKLDKAGNLIINAEKIYVTK